ncbi:uncharacterized protein [Antedon mediterranea]|uniref:uncharacterized protein n=1 Tax=Antedon mediterranea TaxID=105859 RepID=UPI003AF90B4E
MKMVISEFKSKITLVDIQSMTRTHGLISLLVTSGIIKQTNIQVLIEVMKLCGMGGVESVIKPEWNLPKFEEVPITTFSDHRRKLLQFGNTVSDDNMRTIGQLYGIEGETDPYSLILQLEMEGYITERGTMNEFIDKLKDYKMVNEINALTSLND